MNSFFIQNNGQGRFFVLAFGALIGGLWGWIFYQISFGFTLCPNTEKICFPLSAFRNILIAASFLTGIITFCALSFRDTLSGQKNIIAKNMDENLAKDDFLSMVLHHLRTPLTGMMWSIKELATETPDGNVQKPRLERLCGEAARVLNMVEQLIKTTKANIGHSSYSFADITTEELERLVSESISEMRAVAYAKHLSVEIETSPLSRRIARIDRDKIIIVIQTLFENAVIYTKNGGSIRIRIEEKGNDFLFHVSDSGIGIPESEGAKVFTQFFRSSNAKREHSDGVGIGLYLAKIFIKSHNGDITFTSKPKGTTFTVRLPLLIPEKSNLPTRTDK